MNETMNEAMSEARNKARNRVGEGVLTDRQDRAATLDFSSNRIWRIV